MRFLSPKKMNEFAHNFVYSNKGKSSQGTRNRMFGLRTCAQNAGQLCTDETPRTMMYRSQLRSGYVSWTRPRLPCAQRTPGTVLQPTAGAGNLDCRSAAKPCQTGSEQWVPFWEDDVTSARRGRARHRMRKSLQASPESVVFEAKVLEKGTHHSGELHPGLSTCFVNVVSRKKEGESKCHSGH